ncbi:hypothetical protein PVAG01_10330 [Phlyctema vagabunda]|uniref:Heterokaryon incompatibility domain-containing protein n=1 Tax=Phlyctema vagabunda TaxID=108571 RepID=A0ABR4P5M8_9HELO
MNHLPNPIDELSPTVAFYAQQRKGTYHPEDLFLILREKEYGCIDFEDLTDNGLRPDMDKAQAEQFLQSWLFFALLARVLAKPIQAEDFRSENNVLNTSALAGMLKDWAEAWKKAVKHSDLQNVPVQKNQPHDEEPRIKIENESGGSAFHSNITKPHNQLDPAMILSITSLGEILQEEPARGHPEVDHVQAGCTVWQFKAGRNLTDDELSAKHFHDDKARCQGQEVGVGEDRLIQIISQSQVSLVSWSKRGKLSCEGYNLEDVESVPTFSALSHSWVEKILHCGEDASQENNHRMLPCQLTSLRETLHRIFEFSYEENPLFWVDVLCVPRNYEMKGRILNKLNTIFSKASAVLVWDRNLLGRPKPSQEKHIEMNKRLQTGEWSWRLWTLPEAILGKKLYVVFQDDYFFGMDEVVAARQSARVDILHKYHFIWKAGHPFSSPIWYLRQQLRDGKLDFAVQRIFQALQFCISSQQEDETIVLSSILGMNISKLLEIKAPTVKDVVTARMVETMNALDATPGVGIPSGLAFLPQPKLNTNQASTYGWAPKSWMTMQISTYPLFRPLKKTAYMMHKGLHVEFSGIIMHCLKTPLAKSTFWIPVSQSLHKWYKVKVDTGDWNWEELSKRLSGVQELCLVLNSHNPRERWELGLLVRKKGILAYSDLI